MCLTNYVALTGMCLVSEHSGEELGGLPREPSDMLVIATCSDGFSGRVL